MLNPIRPSSLIGSGYTGNSSPGLDVQLEKYKAQLADWVNCPSCKTPEGKAKIQELSDRIAGIEQKMKAAPPPRQKVLDAAPKPLETGSLGSILDTYA